jgi:hypothetical protein
MNRTVGCSYMTAMVLLVANSMQSPRHDDLPLDNHLVVVGLQTVDRIANETGNKAIQSFQRTCTELHQRTQQMCAEAAIVAANNLVCVT